MKNKMTASKLLPVGLIISFLVTPGENTGDALFISPPQTYYQFVGSSITYDCFHSQYDVLDFFWTVNGTNLQMADIGTYTINTIDLHLSELTLANVPARLNNTWIQCNATLLNGNSVTSEVAMFILQGKLKEVGNLQFSIEEFALFISWSPPDSFKVSGSTLISYLVGRYNLSSSNSTADENTTKGTTYTITNNNSSRRLGCDDINVTIIPENPVGLGESSTISLIYEFPQVMNRTFRLNSYGYCDFILILDAPICQVGYYKLSENENRTYHFVHNFDNFMLLNATKNEYWYSFNLELKPLLPYQLDILIFSRNYSKEWHFDIKTNKEFCGSNASFFTSTSIEIQNRQGPGLIVGVTVGAGATSIILVIIIGYLIIIAKCRKLQRCSVDFSDSTLNVSVMQQTQRKVEHELQDRPNYQPNNILEEHQPNNAPEEQWPNNVLKEHQPKNVPEEHQANNVIHVSKFHEYMNKEDERILDQFKVLFDGSGKSKSIGFSQKFKRLNRVSNITVYDDNRIKLISLPSRENQDLFINASYIDGYNKPKKFIATQDPFDDETVELFWHMIYQEKAPVIVMLSKFGEESDTFCKRYYPLTSNIKYRSMEVIKIKKDEEFPKYAHRTLQIKVAEGNEQPFEVHQFNFTAWPNDGVPEYGIPLLKFYQEVQNYCNGDKTPIVVHCRAGVGATGIFISMSNIFEQIKNESVIDIVGTITTIRHQRMAMVQTLEEYEFLHNLIREHLLFRGTEIIVKEFHLQLPKFKEKDAQGKDKFESQFNALQLVSKELNRISKCSVATKYPDKNRCMDNIPLDKHRVVIEGEEEDYIHASFINGYKKKKAYIMAENPMESTAENMLKVVYQEKCSIIVTLSYDAEGRPENSYVYWSKLRNFKQVGHLVVEVIEEICRNGFIVRKMIILKDGLPQTLYQYHINCWRPDGTCSRIESISDVLHLLDEQQVNSTILIHCSDTITRSGIFCALAIICKCIRAGRKKINVSQVVRSVRIHKPGAVPKLSHYKMIFDVLQIYLRVSSYSITSSYKPMSLFK